MLFIKLWCIKSIFFIEGKHLDISYKRRYKLKPLTYITLSSFNVVSYNFAWFTETFINYTFFNVVMIQGIAEVHIWKPNVGAKCNMWKTTICGKLHTYIRIYLRTAPEIFTWNKHSSISNLSTTFLSCFNKYIFFHFAFHDTIIYGIVKRISYLHSFQQQLQKKSEQWT